MSTASQLFIDESRHLLVRSYLPRIEQCLEKMTDEQIWWRANPDSNSVGNLLLHLAGNLRQWIVSGVGQTADTRDRPAEFSERGPIPRLELLSRLRTTVAEADLVLGRLSEAVLVERRHIQGDDVTVMEAVYHVIEHFSMHTGQIILLAKMWAGDVGFFDSSATPRPQWLDEPPPIR
jgi:uncharacterized damage-inducible protein DinB